MESFVSMTWDELKSLADDLPAWGEKTATMAGSSAWSKFEGALGSAKRDVEYRVACEVLRYDIKTCITMRILMNPRGSSMPPKKVILRAENTDDGDWKLVVGDEDEDLEAFAEQAKIEAGLLEILEAHGFGD